MDLIEYKGDYYPKFQSEGFAAQFTFSFADKILKGFGYDIGCNNLDWSLPETKDRLVLPIDLVFNDNWDAMNLPEDREIDYIFSSHCLEHLNDWVGVLDYWSSKLPTGGIIYLYLPHRSQKYWQPQNNRKHIHSFTGDELENYFNDRGFKSVLVSGVDLNHSFTIVAEK